MSFTGGIFMSNSTRTAGGLFLGATTEAAGLKARRNRRIGLSAAAVLLAGTALVPASAQTNLGGAIVNIGSFADPAITDPAEITNGTLVVTTAVDLPAFGGNLTDSGGVFALEKFGIGSITLTGANTYSGGTALNGGTLIIGAGSSIGTGGLSTLTGTTLAIGEAVPSGVVMALANNIALGAGSTTIDLRGDQPFEITPAGAASFDGADLTLNGTITGGGLRVIGNGRITLNGNNSHAATSLESVIAAVGHDSALGAGTTAINEAAVFNTSGALRTLANNFSIEGALFVGGTDAITLNGALSNAGAGGFVYKVGSNDLRLNGDNIGLTSVRLASGNLIVGSNTALGADAMSTENAAALTRALVAGVDNLVLANGIVVSVSPMTIDTGAFTMTLNGNLAGNALVTKIGAGTLVLGGAASTKTGGFTVDNGVVVATSNTAFGDAAGTLTLANGTTLRSGAADLTIANGLSIGNATVDTNGNSFTLSGVVGGAGTLTKASAGTLVLNGANTYAGGTSLNAGIVRIGANSALGTGTLTMAGGTTLTSGAGVTATNAISISGGVTFDTTTASLGLGGVISGSGGFTKTGANGLTLSGANTFTGNIALNASAIAVSGASALGDAANVLQMANGTALGLFNGSTVANAITTTTAANFTLVSGAATVSGAITGNALLTLAGSGALTLSGANGYSGGTDVLSGTIVVGNNTAFGTGSVTMANGTALGVTGDGFNVANGISIGNVTVGTGANTFTLGGVVSGAGLLTKTGAGNLILNGANTYTGGTALNDGTITVGTSTALGTGTLAMANNTNLFAGAANLALANAVTTAGTAVINSNGQVMTLGGAISGAGSITKNGAGILRLSGANSYAGGTTLNVGNIIVDTSTALGTGTLAMASNTFLTAGAADLDLANAITTAGVGTINVSGALSTTLGGVISGAGSITKTGSGTLVLNGANTYAGGTALNTGTIRIGHATALGGGTLTMAGTTTLASGAVLTVNNAIALTGAATFDTPNDLSLSGDITGAFGITKSGVGKLALSGNNSFASLTVNAGSVLESGSDTSLGGGTVSLNAGSTLRTAAFVSLANAITVDGGVTFDVTSNLVLSGQVSGGGGITKTGGATLSFNNAGAPNDFTGDLNLNAGTVSTNVNTGLGASRLVAADGTVLRLSGNRNLANNIQLNGGLTVLTLASDDILSGIVSGAGGLTVTTNAIALGMFDGALTLTNAGNDFTGGITIAAGAILNASTEATLGANAGGLRINDGLLNTSGSFALERNITLGSTFGQVNVAAGEAVTLNGAIGGTQLRKGGDGALVLTNAASNYNGGTQVLGGSLVLGAANVLGAGVVQMFGATSLEAGADANFANNITLEAGSTATISSRGFVLRADGAIGEAAAGLGFTKTGAGTLILGVANTFTGGVTVNEGIVDVRDAASLGTGTATFNAGTTLRSGAGVTLANAIAVAGGVTVDTPELLALGGNITGTGGITKTGTNGLALNGNNNFTGGFTFNAGQVTLGSDTGFGADQVNVAGGTNGISFTGSRTVANNIDLAGATTFTVGTGNTATLNGVITGAGSIVTGDVGRLLLTNNGNTFGGGVSLTQGTLALSANAAAGTGAITASGGTTLELIGGRTLANGIVLNGGLSVQTNNLANQFDGVVSGTGGLTVLTTAGAPFGQALTLANAGNSFAGGLTIGANANVRVSTDGALGDAAGGLTINEGLLAVGGSFTSARAVTLGADFGQFDVDGGQTLTLSGLISGGAGSDLRKGGDGLLIIGNGGNNFGDGARVFGGELRLSASNALGNPGGQVQLFNAGVLGATGTVTIANAVEIVGGATGIDSGAGVFTISGVLSGNNNFTKTGAGILRLTGVNTYNGVIQLNAGEVDVDGSLAGGINAGAGTLVTGVGSVAGPATITGGRLAPGNSPGTLAFGGNLTISGGTNLDFELAGLGAVPGVDADLITVGGNLDINGAVLNITALPGFNVGVGNRDLIRYNGQLLNFSNVTISNPNPPEVTFSFLPVPGVGAFPIAGPGVIQLNVAFAGPYRWDGNDAPVNGTIGGGDGVFNLVNTNFTNSNGTFNLAYGNNATDDIVFGTTAGNVDVATVGINFDQMTFDTTGYTLAGAGSLNANNSAINVGANNATINTNITGGALAKNGAGNLTLAGTNNYASLAVNAGTLTAASDTALGAGTATFAGGTTLAASGTPRALGNAIVINAAGGLTVDAVTNTLALNGGISGTGPLNLVSSGGAIGGRDGVTTLAGVNSYTGGTTATGTTVVINANSGLGEATGSLALDNAELRTTATFATDRAIALNGAVANTINTDTGTNLTANGVISGAAALQKIGAGTLTLTNAGNNYSGGIEMNAGTLSVGVVGALGQASGGIRFTGSSTLQATGDITTTSTVAINNGVTATFDTVPGTTGLRLNGVVSGDGTLTKTGAGRLILTGVNTYAGGTNLNEGTIRINNNASLGTGVVNTTAGTLLAAGLAPGAGTITLNNQFVLGAGQTNIELVGTLQTINTVTGALSTNGTTLVFNGLITGAGGFTTDTATTGRITLNQTNTFTGDVNLNSAILVVNANNATGTGNIVNINASAGIRNDTGGTTRALASGVAINDPNATVGGNGNLVLNGVVSGGDTNVFNKVGLGTVTLANAANTIASQIEVAQGELAITGGLTIVNQLTNVRAGATLSGTGSIAGTVEVVNGGVLSAGVGGNGQVGQLTIGRLLLNEQSSLVFDLGDNYVNGGALNDRVVVTGDLRLGGRLTVRQSTGGNFGLGVYNLFTYGGTLLAGSNGVDVQTLPGAFTGLVQTLVPGQVNLVVTRPGTFIQYWDGADTTGNGAVNGGTGTWSATGTNWTGLPDSQLNTTWFNNSVAVFAGAAGTVTLAQTFAAQGLQFVTDGYTLAGGILDNQSTGVDTGMFVSTDPAVTATINSTIQGDGLLFKQGTGTLVLGGTNTNFSGGTQVQAGTLQLNTALAAGTGSIALLGNVTLANGGGTLSVANAVVTTGTNTVDSGAGSFTLSGVVSGAGGLSKTGTGTLTLSGTNSYTGGTSIAAGTLAVTNNNSIGTGALTINGGTTFRAATDGLSFANAVTLNGLGTVDTQANGLTLSGLIGDGGISGTLVKIGSGNLTLSGANTYTNGTNLNAGSITVANNAALGTGALAMAGGTSLISGADGLTLANAISTAGVGTVNTGANTLTLGGVISGAGSISKTGTGTLVLNGANSYAGGTALTAGTITVGNDTALGGGTLTMTGGTTLREGVAGLALANAITTLGNGTIDIANVMTLNGVISGAGSLTKIGAGVLLLNGANTYAGGTALNAGSITVGNNAALGTGRLTTADATSLLAGGLNISLANLITVNGALTVNSTNTGTFTLSGVIDGAGSLTKVANGNLVLTGANSYTGGTSVNAGTVTVGNNTALGTNTVTMANGTVLANNANNLNVANAFSIGNVEVATGANTFRLSGVVNGAGLLTKTGTGNLILSGSNGYTGGTALTAGSLTITNNNSIGTGTLTTSANTTVFAGLTVGGGSTIALANSVVLNGATTLNLQGTTGDITPQGVFSANGTTLSLNGVVSGAGSLLATGFGRVNFNGANSYSGGTTLASAAAYVGTDTAFGSGTVTANGAAIGNDSGALRALANNVVVDTTLTVLGPNDLTLTGTVSGAGELVKRTTSTLTLNGANSYSGSTQLAGGTIVVGTGTALGTGTLFVESVGQATSLRAGAANLSMANAVFLQATSNLSVDTQAFTFTSTGVISGTGALTKVGTGNLVINGANNFSGGTALNAGTITVGTSTALGTGRLTTADATNLVAGVTGLNAANAVTLNGGLTVDSSTGSFELSGIVDGVGNITKINTGNLILSGVNTYTGGTNLNAGSLTITNNASIGTGTLSTTGGTTVFAGRNDPSGNLALTLANAVVLGAGSTTIDLQGNSINGFEDGTVAINGGTTLTLNGVVSGAGRLVVNDNGRLTLNGVNTYAGGTSATQTALYVGTDSALGTGTLTISASILANDSGALRTLANNVVLAGNSVIAGPNDLTLNGVVSGGATLAKTSMSTLTLNGVNTYTGQTSFFGGRITVGTNSALGTGALSVFATPAQTTTLAAGVDALALANNVTLNASSNLIVESGAGTFTLNGVVSGAGALTKIQAGTLVLNGANTFTGGTALNVGTIQVGTNTALGTNTLAMADATTLQAGVADLTVDNNITTAGVGTIDTQAFTFTTNGVISGAGSITKIGTGNLVLNGANSYTGGSFINAGTATVGNNTAFGTALVTMADGTVLANNASGFNVANNFTIGNVEVATGTNTFTMSGLINGAGLLTKTGTGNLILTGNNSYAGGTALTAGTITFNTNTAFGTGTVTTTGGTTLVAGVNDPNSNQVLTLANAFSLGAGTTFLDLQGASFNFLPLGGVTFSGTNLTLNGLVSGDGALDVSDNGRVTLNGANSYAGGTIVTNAAVFVGSDTALGTGAVNGSNMVLGNDSGSLRTLANNFVTSGGIVVTGPNDVTLNGVVSGGSTITKTSTSTLTLNAANTYTGNTSLIGGRITVGNNAALGTGILSVSNFPVVTTLAAGTTGLALANNVSLSNNSNLVVESGTGTFTLNGLVFGLGRLTKIQDGTLVLNGANTFSGGTTLNVGTIQVGTDTALGTNTLVMADSTTLQAGVDALTLANNITTNGLGVVDTQAFGFTLNGVIGGAGSISKNGSGTLVLNGANTYSGGSFINAGAVTVGNNTALGTSIVLMLNDTTLTAGVDGLALANEFNIGNVTVATQGFGFTLNGPIGGAGLLTKTGSGTLTLNGSNAYGGGTALTAGTINIGTGSALGTGTLTMSDATSLVAASAMTVANNIVTLGVGTIDNIDTVTLTGVISGAGSVTKTNRGNLVLNGLNSYAGGTSLTAGTITVATDSALGTGTLTMASGTTLTSAENVGRAVNSESVVISNAITGSQAFLLTANPLTMILSGPVSGNGWIKTGGGLLVLNGANSIEGISLTAGTIRTGNNLALGTGSLGALSGTVLQNGVAGVTLANQISALFGSFTIDTQAFNYTLNGVISGDALITKIGSANLTLGGANTFTGGFNLNAGSLTLNSSSALGTGTFTAAAGTSLAAGADLTLANAIALGGAFTLDTAANTVTLNGVVSGTGPLGKAGSGNLVLNGVNTYTGGTALNAGTITVANNSALGTGALAMAGGTTLTSSVNNTASSNNQNVTLANAISTAGVATINTAAPRTIILDGVISGAGSIAKAGDGVLVLNAANTYAGGTAFNAGTIRTGNSGSLGTGAVTAAAGTILQAGNAGVTLGNAIAMAGGMTVDVNGRVYGLGGAISGTGPLNVIDTAAATGDALVLSGTNTYTGGTVVTGTTVEVSRDANLGNAAGGITLNGAALRTTASFTTGRNISVGTGGGSLLVAVGTSLTVNGVISGGSLTKNSGELVLTAANTFTGGMALNAGTITVANNAALGTGALAMAGGTTLNTAVNAGTTSNTQNVTLANNVSTAGVGTINANTGLSLILDGFVSGAGSVTKSGAGLLVLNNQNSYTGGTTIAAGTIRAGNGSALGTGAVTMAAGSTLQAGNPGLVIANTIGLTGAATVDTQAFTTTLSGVLSGTGGITKAGTGTLNLTAASTYTGATTIAAGTLNLTGSLASVVTVNSGATLAGTFAVGGLNVAAGGIITPGAPGSTGITTITIPGAVSLAGTYTVNVTPTANDRITAGGALSLAGTLAVVPAVPATFSQFNQTFTVASGATRTGTFGTVTGLDQFGVAFNPVVEYTTTAANIRLAPQSLVTLGTRFGGVSGNQLQVAQAFDRAVAGGFNPQAFFNLYAGGGSALPATLRQMSGEQRATERRVVLDASRTVRESALDRLNGSVSSMGGQQVKTSDGDRTLTFWLRGAGSWSKAQTGEAATAFTTEQRGVLTGLDYSKGAFTVGGMFNYTSTDIEYRVLGGSSNVETVGGTVYAGYRTDGGIVANAGASVAGARTNGARAITLPGFSQSLAGVTTGTSYQVFGELAWDLAGSADTRIEPFARISHVRADMGALAETGGVAALNAVDQGYDITVTNLGMRFGANVAGGKVSLNASASWQGTTGDRDAATVLGIQALGQTSLIRSVQIDRSALNMQLDAGVNLSDTIRFSLGYSGLVGKRNDDHGGRATLNFAF
jgi:fibronectin-binding autotransporter adhesin